MSYSELPNPEIHTQKIKLKGWQGLSDKRQISFGEYYTKDYERGGGRDNTSLFFPSLTENILASKSVKFKQYFLQGSMCELYAVETLHRKGIEIHELDGENVNHVIYEHKISGRIQFTQDYVENFEIDLTTKDQQNIFKSDMLRQVALKYIQYTENDNGRERTIVGTDILLKDKVIAAFRQGKDGTLDYERCWVWIDEQINNNQKLIVSSLISLLADQNRVDVRGKL